ncbi:hypothetical protein Q1695_014503 [Nippostrongylus brasiliensis]|nr:hypothetical protein Q1695_014503 [Nippostrongylus brasiliensis]
MKIKWWMKRKTTDEKESELVQSFSRNPFYKITFITIGQLIIDLLEPFIRVEEIRPKSGLPAVRTRVAGDKIVSRLIVCAIV